MTDERLPEIITNLVSMERRRNVDQEEVGMKEQRQQWGLDIYNLDTGWIGKSDVWVPGDSVIHCETCTHWS